MNKKDILIIGSSGKLGKKLVLFCKNNNIPISSVTSYSNKNYLEKIKKSQNINHSFFLSDIGQQSLFLKHIKNKRFKLVYFLDYGSKSLYYIDILIKNNKNCIFAIANKEMIIAGGSLLMTKIKKSKNLFFPLDSEHFSLFRDNPKDKDISKIFITASGGPFYFKKKINLNKVKLKSVINHPKWKMGLNNSIDSSNFINKILEILELSIIYNINLSKIDFLISREAYIHSIVCYEDRTTSINCYNNDMIISLIKPLSLLFKFQNKLDYDYKFIKLNSLKLEKFNDSRFKIFKYYNQIKKFNHVQQINFLLFNNIAHNKYLNGDLKYNNIVSFIMDKINKMNLKQINFKNFNQIISYIDKIRNEHA